MHSITGIVLTSPSPPLRFDRTADYIGTKQAAQRHAMPSEPLFPLTHSLQTRKHLATIKQTLDELMTLDGALCAAVVDSASGMMLGSIGTGVDLEVAAAGNTEVVRAKMKTMRSLGLNDVIEDILITLGKQYHILRPSARKEGVFIYYVLDKQRANLAMARRKTSDVDKDMNF